MRKVTYFTKDLLIKGNELAKQNGANRQLNDEIEDLPDLKFPVSYSFLHERGDLMEVRCAITVGKDEYNLEPVFLDVPLEFFNALPFQQV